MAFKLEKAIEKLNLHEDVAYKIVHEPLVSITSITVVLWIYDNPEFGRFDRPELLTKMQILESKHEKQQLTDGMHFAAYLIGFFGIVLTYLGFFGKEKSDVKNKVPGI
jgi:hypothetical protein